MTSTLTGALQLRKRLTTSLPSVALAASALVGGATLLSGGEAKAFVCSFGGSGMPPKACDTNIWHVSNDGMGNPHPTDKEILFKVLPTAGMGNIEFKWVDVNSNNGWDIGDQWHVDVDFNGDLVAADGQSTFDYIMKITTPPQLI